LHNNKGDFIPVNIAGVDDTLFSDTLFGHVKGAFTGAERETPGLIKKAAMGTLFLDEIGDLELASQVKLLRLFQESEYYPLGLNTKENAHAWIIAATNSVLEKKVEAGLFRKDLYYRLIHCIAIPPLRERKQDIPL
jgi:transcriptional regulator with PAS, ATPase and Fis domain